MGSPHHGVESELISLDGLTLEEIAAAFGVTKTRIRQIEAKALHKLRHPSRSGHLKSFEDWNPQDSPRRWDFAKSARKPSLEQIENWGPNYWPKRV